jgi:5-(carboxyamino)imidazole ribonucleotide synthase
LKARQYSRIGIVGGGQLGRMLALAAEPLGLQCLSLDRSADTPAAQVAPSLIGALEDPERLAELAARSDVLTFDWENVPAAALRKLKRLVAIRPPPAALHVSQDRLLEKRLFAKLKLPVAAHAAVDDANDLKQAVRRLGLPGLLKTRRLGYDGKGQVVIRNAGNLEEAWRSLGGAALIYEKLQACSREISIVGARSRTGDCVFYPLSTNVHMNGILRYGVAPYLDSRLERTARTYLKRVMHALSYVGVLAIEFFVVNGRLVANEMAPRVHNSGHWTIEGCVTSQFENHVRAICELPLGSTNPLGHTAMINFLGKLPDRARLLQIDGLAFHDYGKSPRPGRKLGHCTILRRRAKDRNNALQNALTLIEWI